MTRSLFMGTILLAAALTASASQPAGAFRGGGFAGGFHGGGAWHAGGAGAWHAGGVGDVRMPAGMMPGTPAVCMATGAEPGTPMAGTPEAFMPVASMARRWSILITAAAAGTAAAPPLPVLPLARRRSALRWALSLPLSRPDAPTRSSAEPIIIWQQWPLLSCGPADVTKPRPRRGHWPDKCPSARYHRIGCQVRARESLSRFAFGHARA
jgi:hypothetical protein